MCFFFVRSEDSFLLFLRGAIQERSASQIMKKKSIWGISPRTMQNILGTFSDLNFFRSLLQPQPKQYLIRVIAKLRPSQPANPQLGAEIALLFQLWGSTHLTYTLNSRFQAPQSQTWKKIKSFRGRVLSTIKISANHISKDLTITRVIVEIIIYGLKICQILIV